MLVLALAGCGGADPVAVGVGGGGETVGTAAITINTVNFIVQPLDARVGQGAGVRFSAAATALGGGSVSYQWYRDGNPIPGQTGTTYTIASARLPNSPAGENGARFKVRATAPGGAWRDSREASLAVVRDAWAHLSGRPLFSSSSAGQVVSQPSVALCGGVPHAAWVYQNGPRHDLHVSRFDGAAWVPVGNGVPLNVGNASAREPSLDCVTPDDVRSYPVVAWVEGTFTSGGTAIYVKAWNGAQWLATGGALNFTAGSHASRPVLRVNPYNPPTGVTYANGVTRLSALAWIEGGEVSLRVWDGSWQPYAGGRGPGGSKASDVALAIDFGRGNAYPPVVAWLQQNAEGLQPYVAMHDGGRWTRIGEPASGFGSRTASAAGRIGIGIGKLDVVTRNLVNVGRVPVVWWADAAAPNTIRSHFLANEHYVQLNVARTWAAYGDPFAANATLRTTAYDPREFGYSDGIACGFGEVPTFGMVMADSSRFEVRRGDCGQSTAVATWQTVRLPHNEVLEYVALRMAGTNDPVVAGVSKVDGSYRLSVWRFYP
jgi:hypothetical protein